MALLKTLLYVLVMLVFIVFGLVFSFRNNSDISVDLLFYQTTQFTVGFWLISSLLTGVLIGFLLFLPANLLNKLKVHRLSIKAQKLSASQSNHSSSELTKGS